MGLRSSARVLAAAAVLSGMGILVVGVGAAGASPVPPDQFTCGNSQTPTACNQSSHFSSVDEVGSPLPNPAPNCPAYLSTDFFSIVGSGNGTEHAIVNKSGDGWFTSTFTGGDITFTAYPPSSITFDQFNNPNISGPPDETIPVRTGKLTEWFGGSFNRNNFVLHDTIEVSATAPDGSTVTLHSVDHSNTTPNTLPPPLGVPHSFAFTNC